MSANNTGALIIQSDLTVLLDTQCHHSEQARVKLALLADVISSGGAIHTYKITPLSLWNAASEGIGAYQAIEWLHNFARYGLPSQAERHVQKWMARYGKLKLISDEGFLYLTGDKELMNELAGQQSIGQWLKERESPDKWQVFTYSRGLIKQELIRLGYHVQDLAGYHAGEALSVQLRESNEQGRVFMLRAYQEEASSRFINADGGGSGIVVLPCGTGKTIVGIAALAGLGRATLILTSSTTSVQQWREELLNKTTLPDTEIGQYCGPLRQVRPVTIATYNLLTHRKSKESAFKHMSLFSDRDWGLIIYDEVHLLPAPIFRMTASIQATRRLGLTATLVREDGCAEDVYSLIGPKLFDMGWKTAESDAYIAEVTCTEIRVPMAAAYEEQYWEAEARNKLRVAAENPGKLSVVQRLLQEHEGMPTLIIGQYLNQLHEVARQLNAPLLTGKVSQLERQQLYNKFKAGSIKVLVVSKIANLAVDLPDAAVAIQLSGSFGSRQEEAQRIGRLLRPKKGCNKAWFYSIVTDQTKETEFAIKRQIFMLEQGYQYEKQQFNSIMTEREESAGV